MRVGRWRLSKPAAGSTRRLTLCGLVVTLARGWASAWIGGRVTLQFQSSVNAQWSIPASVTDDGCYVSSITGSGVQALTYSTGTRRVPMSLYEDRTTMIVSLPPRVHDYTPTDVVPGFGRMDIKRSGAITATFQRSATWTSDCPPQPADVSANASGCGEAHVPWSTGLKDTRDTLTAGAGDWAPDKMLADCPFFAPTQLLHQDERPGQFPSATERFSLATIRRRLAHPSGRLIAQGRQSWQSRTPQFVSPLIHDIGTGDIEVNAVETATWKYTLVRTSGHF